MFNYSCLGIIDLVNVVKKKNLTAYFFNRFVEDIGDFYINKTSLFNYIQLINMRSREPVDIDYTKIEIIGINISLDTVINKNFNLENFLIGIMENVMIILIIKKI